MESFPEITQPNLGVHREERAEVIPSQTVLAEMNAVIGRLEMRPVNTISDRVCQTPRWRRAASATRWKS